MPYELEDLDLHGTPHLPHSRHLPISEVGSLQSLNLDSELYESYAKAKNYLADVQSDESIPPNQLAQLMNTISAILKEIVKMQTELHNAEKVKKLEAAMIQAIKLAPLESQQAFLVQYEAILKEQE